MSAAVPGHAGKQSFMQVVAKTRVLTRITPLEKVAQQLWCDVAIAIGSCRAWYSGAEYLQVHKLASEAPLQRTKSFQRLTATGCTELTIGQGSSLVGSLYQDPVDLLLGSWSCALLAGLCRPFSIRSITAKADTAKKGSVTSHQLNLLQSTTATPNLCIVRLRHAGAGSLDEAISR